MYDGNGVLEECSSGYWNISTNEGYQKTDQDLRVVQAPCVFVSVTPTAIWSKKSWKVSPILIAVNDYVGLKKSSCIVFVYTNCNMSLCDVTFLKYTFPFDIPTCQRNPTAQTDFQQIGKARYCLQSIFFVLNEIYKTFKKNYKEYCCTGRRNMESFNFCDQSW